MSPSGRYVGVGLGRFDMSSKFVAGLVTKQNTLPLVLMYHSVAPYTVDPYQVTVHPERFEEQLRWLHRRGLRGVSVRELLAANCEGDSHGLVGLTFDDGYADFVTSVIPALTRYGFTATVFVVAGKLGGYTTGIVMDRARP
jgi:peptidoglycan/xylan/chitin deacetylase (PgdA/CDA1 family)